MDKRIPVTILTGFLGAGKTTLLNNLIKKYPEKRFAIIENEFGDINIDSDLVIGADENIFEISNGCICCTLNGELVDLLMQLLNCNNPFDHLIIETTGMAEPDGVAAVFVSDPAIQARFRLDGTVCLVDTLHLESIFSTQEEAKKQLTFADYVVLNKISEVTAQYVEKVTHLVKSVNPLAQIEKTDYGKLQNNVLDLNAYEVNSVKEQLHKIHHHHHHHHDHHLHQEDAAEKVKSHSFIIDEPFDYLKFLHWSKVLLIIQGKNIYRIKGIFNFSNEDRQVIFQSVQTQSSMQKGLKWDEVGKRQTQVVFIGKGLKRAMLERKLRSCLAK